MLEEENKDVRARDSEVLMAFVDTLSGLSGSMMQCAQFFMYPRDGDVFYLVACVSLQGGWHQRNPLFMSSNITHGGLFYTEDIPHE